MESVEVFGRNVEKTMNTGNMQAVIFDMDGVLIDSEPFWRQAELSVFHSYDVPLVEEHCRKMTGTRIDQLVNYYLTYFKRKDLDPEKITNQIVDALIDLVNRYGHAMPGALEALSYFSSLNLPLALASSSSVLIIEAVLKKTGLESSFEVVHSGAMEIYGKPHPAVYLTTAEKLNADPYYCLAIEDAVNGVIAAKAARMKCLAVPEHNLLNDRRFGVADLILPDLKQLAEEWQSINNLFV